MEITVKHPELVNGEMEIKNLPSIPPIGAEIIIRKTWFKKPNSVRGPVILKVQRVIISAIKFDAPEIVIELIGKVARSSPLME